MRNILTNVVYELEKKKDLVYVTIIKDNGSSPRGAGSVMLVDADGYLYGTIGGGKVEALSITKAMECLEKKQSCIMEYSLTQSGESSIGMACGGDVTVYYQYVEAGEEWEKIAQHGLEIIESGKHAWLVFDTEAGKCSLITDRNQLKGINENDVDDILAEDKLVYEGKMVTMPFGAEDRVLIFGAGHVSRALAPVLKSVGFSITVMDNREEMITEERFPDADRLICGDFTRISDYLTPTAADYIVIMTNGHSHDMEVESQVLRTEHAYVGVIGSRKKTEAVNNKLWQMGLTKEMTDIVHTPIGLAIKAITPEEIAVSIAAEMILVRAELRMKKGDAFPKGCPMK